MARKGDVEKSIDDLPLLAYIEEMSRYPAVQPGEWITHINKHVEAGVKQALDNAQMTRPQLLDRFREITGQSMSDHMLRQYLAPGKTGYKLQFWHVAAIVEATDDPAPLLPILARIGRVAATRDEIRLAELGHLVQVRRRLNLRIGELQREIGTRDSLQ